MSLRSVDLKDLSLEPLLNQKTGLITSPAYADKVVEIPDKLGKGLNYLMDLGPDIKLMFTDTEFNEPVSFESKNSEMCGAIVVLDGEISIGVNQHERKYVARKGQAILFMVGETDCMLSYPKGRIKMINFTVSKKLMAQLGVDNEAFPIIEDQSGNYDISCDCLWKMQICPEINRNVQHIYETNLRKDAHYLYTKGKVIEILALLYHCHQEQLKTYPSIKPYDLNCIMQAAELIENNMTSPPSLYELARKVGINDNKLKKLFKVVFNNTVYGHLNKRRMQYASELLIKGELSVQEVAQVIGFKHVGYFSKLFRETYSLSPRVFKLQYQASPTVRRQLA